MVRTSFIRDKKRTRLRGKKGDLVGSFTDMKISVVQESVPNSGVACHQGGFPTGVPLYNLPTKITLETSAFWQSYQLPVTLTSVVSKYNSPLSL